MAMCVYTQENTSADFLADAGERSTEVLELLLTSLALPTRVGSLQGVISTQAYRQKNTVWWCAHLNKWYGASPLNFTALLG